MGLLVEPIGALFALYANYYKEESPMHSTNNLIHTPGSNIPVAEAFLLDNHIILRFKKHGSNIYEEVSLDTLLRLIFEITGASLAA